MTNSKPSAPAAAYTEAAALREALRVFARRSELAARAAGLTPRIYQLLLMIRTARSGNGRASFSELEERLQLGKSTVTELVSRCERRRLVRRELDAERRGIRIRLTPDGERRLTRVVAELGDERRHLLSLLAGLAEGAAVAPRR
jgi:DNA-binding MarR family transcriptional regulator